MKLFLPFAVSFLLAAGLQPVIPAACAEEKSMPVPIPEPEEKMIGEWLGFMTKKDTAVLLTRNTYRFLASGTWEIANNAADEKPQTQGWYKINRDDHKLLLQPREAAIKDEAAAIHAELRDENTFLIPDPLDENNALAFIRKDSLPFPSAGTLAGKWKIFQMDLESGEKREAPYSLVLKKDGTYSVEQPGKKLPKEWAQGTFELSGLRVQLHNKFSGTGLWQSPSFFFLNGDLRYNDSRYCLWCEKDQKKDDEKKEKSMKQ
jgi:hypothetical protein